jgi:hypothetical protein
MAAEAGVTDAAVGQLFDTKKTKVFEQAFADVTAKIKEQQAIVEKYNLNWTNFAGPKRLDEFSKALKGVTSTPRRSSALASRTGGPEENGRRVRRAGEAGNRRRRRHRAGARTGHQAVGGYGPADR